MTGASPASASSIPTSGVVAAVLTDLGLVDPTTTELPTGEQIVVATSGRVEPEAVVAALVGAGIGVRGFETRPPRLEDLFVSLTGEGFDVSR